MRQYSDLPALSWKAPGVMDLMYDDPFSTALQRLQQLQVRCPCFANVHPQVFPALCVSHAHPPFCTRQRLSPQRSHANLLPTPFYTPTQQNDFAEAIQRSELDTWTFTKEVDNPELQGLARIRGHLDVMAQQLSALGEIEEAHKAEKNVVLEKLEHARVELFTAIDAAMPRISHEKAIVQAALEFVELPGDRERLRSPGLAHKTGDRVSAGRTHVDRNSFHAGDPGFISSKSARRSPHAGSVADSAPRSLNFTDVDSSGEEEMGSDNYDDDDDYDDDYGEVPGSGWVVAGFLTAILGVGLHVNRKHLGVQVKKWRDERLGYRTTKLVKHQPRRRADSIVTEKPHIQQRQQRQLASCAQHQVSSYELQRLEERDAGVMSLTTSERTFGQVGTPRAPDAARYSSTPARQRPTPRPSSPPRSPPRLASWRWRPHVLLGRG
jgi:hypothetical protein